MKLTFEERQAVSLRKDELWDSWHLLGYEIYRLQLVKLPSATETFVLGCHVGHLVSQREAVAAGIVAAQHLLEDQNG